MFLSSLFSPNCIICKKEGSYLCKDCKKLIQVHPTMCPICHRKQNNFKLCENCKSKFYLDEIIIGFKYDKFFKKLILGLKYFHKYEIAKLFVEKMKYILEVEIDLNQDIIFTSVPTHWFKKYFIKGYNQSEILAKYFAQFFGKSYINFCKKIKYTVSQTKLNRRKRLTNLKNSFDIKIRDLDIQNKTIIIVDDIITTGATLNEVALCIKKYFPENKIIGLAIARH